MKRSIVRHLFSTPAAMLYTLAAYGLHQNLGSPRGASAVAAALASYVFLNSVALWILADAQRRQRALPYDYGSFVFFGWLVVVPVYLWWTRRWRAVIPLFLFAVLCVLAAILSSLPHWL
jgi:hypothetical protein